MSSLKLLALSAAAAALLAPQAVAQDREEIQVTAPQMRVVPGRHLGVPEKISLSREVSYSDLDLRDSGDVAELRTRVRNAAREVCSDLDKMYAPDPKEASCYRTAYSDAILRVNSAVSDARRDNYYRARYSRH